jgi:hypothetical protein
MVETNAMREMSNLIQQANRIAEGRKILASTLANRSTCLHRRKLNRPHLLVSSRRQGNEDQLRLLSVACKATHRGRINSRLGLPFSVI